jgi:hypothetical protein
MRKILNGAVGKKRTLRTWLTRAGILGIGLLPCPDCGTPIMIKYWPAVVVIALTVFLRKHLPKTNLDQNPKGE